MIEKLEKTQQELIESIIDNMKKDRIQLHIILLEQEDAPIITTLCGEDVVVTEFKKRHQVFHPKICKKCKSLTNPNLSPASFVEYYLLIMN